MFGRITRFVGRHRVAAAIAATFGVALIVFVLVWFQPQKLFLDQRVDEQAPEATARKSGPAGADQKPQQAETQSKVLASGAFQRLEHPTTGKAQILELASGQRVLRFDDLNTSNGPDLHVYLSEIPPSNDWYAYGERFVSLGKLKGNIGSQNYALPDDLDLSRFKSAVVWCKRFAVGFGVAGLPDLASLQS